MEGDNINNIMNLKPSEFMEKYMNIKLFNYQKLLIDNLDKCKYFIPSRGCNKRITRFIQIYNHLIHMKDDDIVTVVKPDGNVQMDKKEFISWLANEF